MKLCCFHYSFLSIQELDSFHSAQNYFALLLKAEIFTMTKSLFTLIVEVDRFHYAQNYFFQYWKETTSFITKTVLPQN